MKETKLFDDLNDLAAISVTLEDVKKHILEKFKGIPEKNVTIHYDDYDDYGCDHYVEISGISANLILKKNYGGMFCPSNSLVCSVSEASGPTLDNERHSYHLKEKIKEVLIGSNYANRITDFINLNKKYLLADSALFTRYESVIHNDSRANLMGNPKRSISSVELSDEDFHTSSKNISDFSIRNIELWGADGLNILVSSENRLENSLYDYKNFRKINEWDAIKYLIEDKKRLWVLDELISCNSFFYINSDGELSATTDENIMTPSFNLGEYKELSISQLIIKARKAGLNYNSLVELIHNHCTKEESVNDEDEEAMIYYYFKDESKIAAFPESQFFC
jgi:hypothetical protein